MDQGKIAAWSHVEFFADTRKKHVARLGFITDKNYRRRGYCTQLLDHIIDKFGRRYKLTATTNDDNPMKKIFLSRGFLEEGCFMFEEYDDDLGFIHISSLGRQALEGYNGLYMSALYGKV